MVKKTNSLTSNVAADVNLSVGVARVFYATRKCTQPFAPRSMRLVQQVLDSHQFHYRRLLTLAGTSIEFANMV